jgi:hypothetical protein
MKIAIEAYIFTHIHTDTHTHTKTHTHRHTHTDTYTQCSFCLSDFCTVEFKVDITSTEH